MKKVVSNLLLIIGIVLVIFAGYNLYRIYSDYNESNALYDDLNSQYVSVPDSTGEKENIADSNTDTEENLFPWYELANVDLESVRQINSDVIGWIYFENEEISYPILYSGDDDKYLRTTLEGKAATAGSIFLEGQNQTDFNDSHTIIYGHNMRNLSMFGKLKYYKNDGYYEEHPYFQIHTSDRIYRYEIFAYEDVAADSKFFSVPYSDSPAFADFIGQMYRASYKDTGVKATSSDKIITLSTCSSDDNRFLVHAVRIDTYER